MRKAPARRVLRTVMFTDIVGSTQLAAELGDRRWRRTVASHNTAIRRELKRNHGQEIDTAGDGFFAIFENPTDAVRCAAAAIAAVHGLGLRIRAGIHTGEVEPAGAKVGGIAVHIGARLLALAGMEEVLVSSTVRDLVAGSGHDFENRGMHELRGVPGEWHVYALVLPQIDKSIAVEAAEDDDERRAAANRRQRALVGGLVGVIALLVIGIGVAFIVATQEAPPPSGPNTVLAYDPGRAQPVRGWGVGAGPSAMALADGVLWVTSSGSGTITRIDLASGRTSSIGQGGAHPSAVLVDAGKAFIADRYANQLSFLIARDGALLDRFDQHVSGLASSPTGVWAANDLADRLVLVDPVSGPTSDWIAFPASAGPTALAVAADSLWAAAPRVPGVQHVDTVLRTVTPAATELSGVDSIGAAGGDLWLSSSSGDNAARVDSASGHVEVRVPVCDTPIGIAVTPSGAWVACSTSHELWRVDRTGSVTDRIHLDGIPAALVVDGERAWVALRGD
jgi:class 3 adenylate cyclase/streptogramin lyase